MQTKSRAVAMIWLSAAVLVLIAISGWLYALRKESPLPVHSSAQSIEPSAAQPNNTVAATAVYEKQIIPLLDEFDRDNAAAIDRALQTFHDRMKKHHDGVPHFASDMVRWGTRAHVVGRYASDAWQKYWNKKQNVDTVRDYVSGKFQNDVMSAQQLNDDVLATLEQFSNDMEANRRKLFASMSLPLSQIHYAEPITGADYSQFCQDLQQRTADLAKSQSKDSLGEDLDELTELGKDFEKGGSAGLSADLVEQVAALILAEAGTDLGIEIADAGGATVAGGGIGAGGGTLVEPGAGTIIGAGVGLLAGFAVDWWMSDKFEAKLTTQCDDFLDTVEHDVCLGHQPGSRGLRDHLSDAVRLVSQDQRSVILSAMKEAK